MNEHNDPEASYRRGYQQGAYVAMEAAERLLGSSTGLRQLRKWTETALFQWRYYDRTSDRSVPPPEPPN